MATSALPVLTDLYVRCAPVLEDHHFRFVQTAFDSGPAAIFRSIDGGFGRLSTFPKHFLNILRRADGVFQMPSNYGTRPAKRLFNERRGITRDRSGQKAAIRLGRGLAGQCTVRDLSDGGARLTVDNPADFPARFEVRIGRDSRWRHVQVRWRTRTELGVAFV